MKIKSHYIFFIFNVFFFQILYKPFVFFALGLISLYSLIKIDIRKILSFHFLIILLAPIYWIYNLYIHGIISQMKYASFFRYDGKFFLTWFIFIIFFIIKYNFSYKNIFYLLESIYFSIFLIMVFALPYNIIFNFKGYFTSFFTSHNAAAGLLASNIIIGIILKKYNKELSNKKKYYSLILYFSLFLFIYALSRAFILALGFSYLIYGWKNGLFKIRKKVFWKGFFILIFLITFSIYLGLLNRILQAVFLTDYNTLQRLHYWSLGLNLFKNNKIIGNGIGTFNDISYKIFAPEDKVIEINGFLFGERHAHNIFLQLLSEQGIMGVVFFFLPFLYIFRKIKKLRKVYYYDKIYLLLNDTFKYLFILLFVASMFGLNFFTPSTSTIFYIISALYLSYIHHIQSNRKEEKIEKNRFYFYRT